MNIVCRTRGGETALTVGMPLRYCSQALTKRREDEVVMASGSKHFDRREEAKSILHSV
jgi:hypothetical protein